MADSADTDWHAGNNASDEPRSTNEGVSMINEHVLSYLSVGDLGHALAVSRMWRTEAERPGLWKSLDARAAPVLERLLELPRFAQLEELNLECCRDVLDHELRNVPGTLTRLNLNAVHSISPASILELVAKCHGLRELELYWQPEITDSVLRATSRHLTSLNVAGCKKITDRGIFALSKLTYLDVTRCPRLTDASLRHIADFPLKTLILYADSNFSDAGFGALANGRAATKLEKLDVCGARFLTSAGLAALTRRLGGTLTYLNCTWCVSLGDDAVLALASVCSVLSLLSLHGIINITDKAVDALAASRCATTLTTFDINGCAKVTDYRRNTSRLFEMFPNVRVWSYHR